MEDLLVNTRRKVLFTLICFFILLSSGKVHVMAAAVDSAVEVFKDCPKETKLYSTIYGDL